ncbi:MAG: DEAD/DEAH box helicase [Desulfohalobiaceae bacterium]|nr:DEAD/DEAH box helicase [Desulfohalobiaceae bacterium]
MKESDISGNSWQESLKHYFPQAIRTRGNSYARKGRVRLKRATFKLVTGQVRGSRAYSVEIAQDEEDESKFRILCTCPYFRRGNACKHLWAAIVAADRTLTGTDAPTASTGKSPSSAASDDAPPPSQSSRNEHPAPRDQDWRSALFPRGAEQNSAVAGLDGAPGEFRLCYELRLTGWSASLNAYQQYIRRNGEPGRTKGVDWKLLNSAGLPREDHLVLKILQVAAPGGLSSSFPVRVPRLSHQDLSLLLPCLARSGRCRVHNTDGNVLAFPLREGEDLRVTFLPEGNDASRAETLQLKPVLVSLDGENGQGTDLEEAQLICPGSPPCCLLGDTLHRLEGVDSERLEALQSSGFRVRVPRREIGDFVEALETHGNAPAVELPEDLRFREVQDISPLPRLCLEIGNEGLQGDVAFLYGEFAVSPGDQRQRLLDRQSWSALIRDREAEGRCLAELEESGFEPSGDSCACSLERAPEAIQALTDRGWHVEGKDGKPLRKGTTPSVKVSSSGMDWFDLEGEIEFSDTSVDLPRAVREFLQGNRTVRLDDGSRGMLPLDWLRRHAGELALGLETEGSDSRGPSGESVNLRYHKSQALVVDHMVAQDQHADLEDHFLRIRDELRRFEGLEPREAPAGFRGTLREYQKEGLSWFEFLIRFGFGGVLADDMGLGKTIQVLALLQQRKRDGGHGPSLVVAPASLVFNWREEAGRFAPQLEVVSHVGPDRATEAGGLEGADLVLTTYGILLRDAAKLSGIEFDIAVLDESQAIKNSRSKTFRAAKALRARHRLCLTGTPLENSLAELWSQMDFLNPGLLRSSSRFEEAVAGPVSRGDAEAGESLRRLIKPFILRRTKEQVAPELPDKAEHTLTCPMLGDQSRLYRQILAHYRESVLQAVDSKGMNRSKIKVLEGLLRLRQIACHPGLVDPESSDSGKMDKLRELVREVRSGGHKALIFSQYTKLLGLIKQEFDWLGLPYFSLDGRTTQKRRKQRVDAFQETEESCFFLISLKAGGTGLNLTAADYVFILDPWWNPAVEMQAVDRTHRIGQEKKVVSYRLITEGSVEEKVLSLQEKKQEMVSSVLSGSNDMIKNLTRRDLEHLFS